MSSESQSYRANVPHDNLAKVCHRHSHCQQLYCASVMYISQELAAAKV